MVIAHNGRWTIRIAVAGGPINKVKISSAPTTCTDIEIAMATKTKKVIVKEHTGIPRIQLQWDRVS